MVSKTRRKFLKVSGAATAFGLAGCLQDGGSGALQTQYMDTPGYEDFFSKHTSKFEEETGIEVEYDFVGWGDAKSTMQSNMTAKSGPDVHEIASTWIPAQVEAGGWMDLRDEAAAQQLPDTSNYPSGALEVGQFDDMLVGIPWYWGPRAWQESGPKMDEAGIEGSPENWDELVSQGTAYNEVTSDGDYFGAMSGGIEPGRNFAMFLWQNGGSLLNEDNSAPAFNSEAGVEAMNFYKDLIVEHEIIPEASLDWESSGLQSAFAGGEVASTWGALSMTNAYADADGNSRDELRVSAPPKGPDGDSGTFFGMELLGIASWSNKVEEAAQWIDYLAQPEVNAELADIAGFLPPTSGGMNTELYSDPFYETFDEEVFPAAKTYPQVRGWGEIETEIYQTATDILNSAVTGNWSEGDTKSALDDAASVAEEALNN
ncbi:extracellular solute-binding protein [Salinarchaeum laminariae]|uniref:extracellular solute-binding protein n=1 Tax=Salinarchaeum laminariae TaxID=869888 RepID=UPI0020C1674D|nr:extracellular solute-binding protein [Salinarchaeum laminariae]